MALPERVVVLVEDDMAMRQAIERVLGARGIPVLAFASAEAAIEADCVRGAACLVVDIKLPGRSGFEFYEALETPPPVVFISAQNEAGMRERSVRLGAAAFLNKPFSGRFLADLVATLRGTP